MKLLLLVPNFILLAISGYNLYSNVTSQGFMASLAANVLHLSVMVLCLMFVALIVRSMFSIRYVEMPEKEGYKQVKLQHSV